MGVKAGSGTVGGKEREGPWAYLSRVIEESGFGSKNPKAREQVSRSIIIVVSVHSKANHPTDALRRRCTT